MKHTEEQSPAKSRATRPSASAEQNATRDSDKRSEGRLRLLKGGTAMAKYGEKASEKVEKAMHERKEGTLKSGRSGKKVKSRKQAIAIGLSEARRAGAKVPPKKSSSKKK
jgi:hypothetical protein